MAYIAATSKKERLVPETQTKTITSNMLNYWYIKQHKVKYIEMII